MRCATSAILIVLLPLAPGCSGDDAPAPSEGEAPATRPADEPAEDPAAEPDVGALRPFEESGETVFRVDGVPVPRASFERFAEAVKSFNPHATDYRCRLTALENIIIPQVQSWHRHREELPELERSAEAAVVDLRRGMDFEEVVGRHFELPETDDPDVAARREELIAKKGDIGYIPRVGAGSGITPILRTKIWEADVGEVVGPFLDVTGVYLFRVENERKGPTPARDERRVRVLLFAYEPGRGPRSSERARVTDISDPAIEKEIPLVYRPRGEGR